MKGWRFAPLLLASLLAGCAAAGAGAPAPARIRHVVLLKLDDPAQTEALLRDCDATFPAIPGVAGNWSGRPLDSDRDPVDRDYDVGLCLGFASEADYERYIRDPDHQALTARWRPRLRWIRIHDVDVTSARRGPGCG